jgi:altronate dehydratase small subunit
MRALRIDRNDNVAVALVDLCAGEEIQISGEVGASLTALAPIPFGHKVALADIAKGSPVLKYGVPVALASAPIRRGEWVHVHNVESYFVARKKQAREEQVR